MAVIVEFISGSGLPETAEYKEAQGWQCKDGCLFVYKLTASQGEDGPVLLKETEATYAPNVWRVAKAY